MSRVIKSSRVIEEKSIFRDEKEIISNEILKEIEAVLEKANKESEHIMREAKKRADIIINEANKKSQEVLELTYQKSKEITKGAKLNGYNDGHAKGYNEGKIDSDELIKEANEIKNNYFNERRKILNEIESDVIDLVICTCENILNNRLSDKDNIIALIKKGLDKIDNSDIYSITVSEEDFSIVEIYKDRIVSYSSLVKDIEIRVDSKLIKGDVIIETSKGAIDTSVSTQIEQVKKLLFELLGSE